MKLVIDTDAGVDDAFGILLALSIAKSNPDFELCAITTVFGNTTLENVNRNVATLLAHAGCADVPVYHGAPTALVVSPPIEKSFHGDNGFGDASLDWAEAVPKSDEHAALAIVRLANQYPGELTIITLGPLTNLAIACSVDRTLPSKVKNFTWMGGSPNANGNSTPVAEFNVFSDPEAAHVVLEAFSMSTMVSWDLTLKHMFAWSSFDACRAADTKLGRLIKAITQQPYVDRHPTTAGAVICDALAVALVLSPSLVAGHEQRSVKVVLDHGGCRGQTVVDRRIFEQGFEPINRRLNVTIVTDVDQAALDAFVEAVLVSFVVA